MVRPVEDRRGVALLLVPFVLMAVAMAINNPPQMPVPPPVADFFRTTDAPRAIASTAPLPAGRTAPAGGSSAVPFESSLPLLAYHPALPIFEPSRVPLVIALPAQPFDLPSGPPLLELPIVHAAWVPLLQLPVAAPAMPARSIEDQLPALAFPAELPVIEPRMTGRLDLAALAYPPVPPTLPVADPLLPVSQIAYRPLPPFLPPPDAEAIPTGTAAVCLPKSRGAPPAVALDRRDFGRRLAAAARTQLEDLVIYTARYQRIAFPKGDVPSLFGACTDVVIRAYRSLGVDLQALVQGAGVGSGDPSIDHRRTETLRRFFSRHAEVLPVSEFPESYQPGDIVTYHRPFSRVSRSHIAIVTDVLGPSGRPMILHNRGWGPQLEDALFVDRITGHYRYAGPVPRPETAASGGLRSRGVMVAASHRGTRVAEQRASGGRLASSSANGGRAAP